MPSVEVPGATLFIEQRGEQGDPMVLVHGSWVDHRTWNLILPSLAESFSVVVYDRRGHGRSSPRRGPYRIEDDVEDLANLLERLDHFPTHVVGLSLGGTIAVRLAALRPDLFRGLVVHEPPIYALLGEGSAEYRDFRARAERVVARWTAGDRPGAAHEFVRSLAGSEADWERIGRAGQELLVSHADRWIEEYRSDDTFRIDPAGLAEFYAPTLLTNGALSPPVFAQVLDALASALPNATRQQLPRTAHMPHLTDPHLFAGVLFSFCAERNVPTS